MSEPTPRERQIARVEAHMALGIRSVKIDTVLPFHTAFRNALRNALPSDMVAHAHPADVSRLESVNDGGLLETIDGVRIVRDPATPQGLVELWPARVNDLVGRNATPPSSSPVTVGLDPAWTWRDGTLTRFTTITGLDGTRFTATLTGLST